MKQTNDSKSDSFDEMSVRELALQTRRVIEVARNEARSANARSNDTQREINQLILSMDGINTNLQKDISTLNQAVAILIIKIEELEKPWYERLWTKITCRNKQ